MEWSSAPTAAATFAANQYFNTIEQPTKKMFAVGSDILYAFTGQGGLGQRFEQRIVSLRGDATFNQGDHLQIGRSLCASWLQDLDATRCPAGQFGALVAFGGQGRFHLCEFPIMDFQPEFKTERTWFVSMGSGQPIADPFLGMLRRVFFRDDRPTVSEGVFTAVWTLAQAIDLNTGGINGPVQVGTLKQRSDGSGFEARLLSDEELAEPLSNVGGVEQHLALYRDILAGKTKVASPPSPPPPP